MAGGLMVGFVVLQMALGIFFIVWLWTARIRSVKEEVSGLRDKLLWFAVTSLTIGVVIDFYFMLARNSLNQHERLPVLTSFSLACMAVIFALLGKGKGRVVTVVAAGILAITWLPFVLP
jgi:hypothetical protein